jgi:hypothetical protein
MRDLATQIALGDGKLRAPCATCGGKGWLKLACGGADECLDCLPLRAVAFLLKERRERVEAVARGTAKTKVYRRVFRAIATHPRLARAFA